MPLCALPSLEKAAALHYPPGSFVPYAFSASGAVTRHNAEVGETYACPACSQEVFLDRSVSQLGKLRHLRKVSCPYDDPTRLIHFARQRLKDYLDTLSHPAAVWPWLTTICDCGHEAIRDLRDKFKGYRAGEDFGCEFCLLDANGNATLAIFINEGAEKIRALHATAPKRFLAISAYRALWYPSVWRLDTVDGVENFRGIDLPVCPACSSVGNT